MRILPLFFRWVIFLSAASNNQEKLFQFNADLGELRVTILVSRVVTLERSGRVVLRAELFQTSS